MFVCDFLKKRCVCVCFFGEWQNIKASAHTSMSIDYFNFSKLSAHDSTHTYSHHLVNSSCVCIGCCKNSTKLDHSHKFQSQFCIRFDSTHSYILFVRFCFYLFTFFSFSVTSNIFAVILEFRRQPCTHILFLFQFVPGVTAALETICALLWFLFSIKGVSTTTTQ